MLAHGRHLRHGRDHALREVVGVRAREPQPADARDRAHRPQQVGEVVLAVVIRVDRLAKQRHLRRAALDQVARLAQHVGQSPAPLLPARHRNYAERALVIAAALDRDPRRRRARARGEDVLVVLGGAERGLDAALALARAPHQLGQLPVAVGARDEVHVRRPLQQAPAQPLRHAPHHAQHVARPLGALQLADAPQHALLRVIAHRAGVDDHDLRLVGRGRADEPLAQQQPRHQLGVGLVHLAAVGLDVERARGRHTASARSVAPRATSRAATRARPSAHGASAGRSAVR